MRTSDEDPKPRAIGLTVDAAGLTLELADGRRLFVPLSWFPRLAQATPAEREDWRLVGDGQGVHWPRVDEDLSVDGLVAGRVAPGGAV